MPDMADYFLARFRKYTMTTSMEESILNSDSKFKAAQILLIEG